MARFRSPLRRRSSSISTWWVVWRMPILLLIVMAVWWFLIRPVSDGTGWVSVTDSFAVCGESGPRQAGCVVDGDTLVLGFGNGQRRIRITGFDAPELEGACEAESAKAREARSRVHQWLGEGPFEWDGAAEPPRDQYGRELREVRRLLPDGSYEYLGRTMIDEGLASESGWGSFPVDWCA